MAKAVLIRQGKAGAGWHPWVFRSDIAQVSGTYEPGDVLDVVSSRGRFLGRAFYNPKSQISLRMMTLHDEPVDRDFIFRRVREAVEYRRAFADLHSCRLIFAESDRLPALIVDSFGDVLVMQCLALGMERLNRMSPTRWWSCFIPQESMSAVMCPCAPWRVWSNTRPSIWSGSRPGGNGGNGVHFWVDVKQGQKTASSWIKRKPGRHRTLCAGRPGIGLLHPYRQLCPPCGALRRPGGYRGGYFRVCLPVCHGKRPAQWLGRPCALSGSQRL